MFKKKDDTVKVIVIALVFGFLAGALTNLFMDSKQNSEKTKEQLIQEFYDVETAVHVSPHGLRKHIDEGKYVIVDLRSQEEYETAHVVGALSVPAYATPDKSDYGAVDRIVNSFKKIQAENPDTPIVVYCYSGPCMTGRKIGKMLADHGIYVEHLGIGWSEWRYYWNMWNHDGETAVNPEDYVVSGPEPGVFESDLTGAGCPIEGEFGC
jgi:rhodanese-related sulfurtransferase